VFLRTVSVPSGTGYSYASAETRALGLVLRNAIARPVADYLRETVWEPIGAEAEATWLTTASARKSLLLHQCSAAGRRR